MVSVIFEFSVFVVVAVVVAVVVEDRINMMTILSIVSIAVVVVNVIHRVDANSCTASDYIQNTAACPNECDECERNNWDERHVSCQRCFCASTKRMPSRPIVGYDMCHMYNSRSCCIPVRGEIPRVPPSLMSSNYLTRASRSNTGF